MRVNRLLPGLAACLALSSVLAYWQLHRAPAASSGTAAVAATTSQGREGITAAALGAGGVTQWQFLGPNNVGGPTSFVGFRPDNASVAYAVTHGGDVFRSDDAGGLWTFKGHLPLRGAKLEFVSGEAQTLYAYADEFRQTTQGEHAVPLFKSTDGGQTWTEVRPQENYQWWWLWQVHSLRTIAGQPGVLWATTYQGLVRSTDDGLSWTLVYSQGGGTRCSDLEISLAKSRVYAACSTPAWNVIAAPLDGSSWSQLTQRSGTESHFARLAMAKSNQSVIYLVTFGDGVPVDQTTYLGSITRTTDGGTSWQTRYDRAQQTDIVSAAVPGDFEFECQAPNYGALTIGQSDVVVDPANSALLWIAGFEIYRSNDGGTTFGRVRARAEQINEPALGAAQGMTGAQRYTTLAFPPNYNGTSVQTVIAGGRTGIERTDAARATAQTATSASCDALDTEPGMAWTAINNGYSATRLVHGEMLANGETVVSGPDMDVGVSDGSGPDSWARITPLKAFVVGQVAMDPTLGTDRFIVSWPLGLVNWSWDSAQSKWGANAQNFVSHGNPRGYLLPYEDEVYRNWDYPRIARDPKNRLRLAAASPDGVFLSTDNGSSWTLTGPSIAVSAVGFKRDGSLVAGTADGYILAQLGPNAQQWEKRDRSGCVLVAGHTCTGGGANVSEFALSPNPADNGIYATSQGWGGEANVWYSANGSTWQALDNPNQAGGLPRYIGSVTLAIDADNPRHLYVGTPKGLFASEDNGASWTEVDNPFPGTPVVRLQFLKDASKGTRKLVAFTYGRGAWVANIAASTTFADVPTYYWAHDFIQKLYSAGITGGCTSSPLRYCPTQTVLRDQMAVFLLRAKHGRNYQPPAASGDFSDVATSYWAAAWIERLRDEGITGGCGTNPLRYCPTNSVRREEIAVFLLRAKHGASYQPPAATGMYADVPANYWAAAWIEQLSREGIGGGCSTTPKNYCPTSPVTRDQMAAFLVRAFGL